MNGPCEIVMERSMNEHWGVTQDGELADFRGDGGASEFSNYLCTKHDVASGDWDSMVRHVSEESGADDTAVLRAIAE